MKASRTTPEIEITLTAVDRAVIHRLIDNDIVRLSGMGWQCTDTFKALRRLSDKIPPPYIYVKEE